jgi:hypothetical protein
MRLPPASALLSCLLLAAASEGLSAQSLVLEGGSVERYLRQPGHAVAFTYRRTEVSRHGFGIDLAVGIFPAALAGRTARLQVDAGFARTQALGPARLVLKAGMGSRLDVGPSPEFIPGLQAGIAAVIPLEGGAGLRVDLTRRQLFPDGGSVVQWSIAVGITILPLRRPASPP